jgi:hypothetical protein
MAMNITLTLTAGLGADLGPNFNLTSNVGSVTPSTATKTELTTGKSVSVDDAATQVTITSTGTCTNALTLNISGIPATTTTTTTTTTTAAPTTTTTTTTTEAPTTTTTTGAPASFTVKNTSGSGVISDVYGPGGIYFYITTAGSFPISNGQQVDATGASRTGDDIIVEISSYSSTSCLSLYINGGLSQSIAIIASGTVTFTNKTFTSSDVVLIEYISGACP